MVQREMENRPLWVSYIRETVSRRLDLQGLAASPRGFYRFVANPERGWTETGDRAGRPPFGLGPRVGAQVASRQNIILRPGRQLFYRRTNHQATTFWPAL